MLTFIVPLKSPGSARSELKLYQLLERTLRSICAQTSNVFRCIVVCNEIPKLLYTHPAIEYVLYGQNNIKPITREQKNTDKCCKIRTGIEAASRYNPDYIMVVDADDCVSSKVVEFVSLHPQHSNKIGWIVNKGYFYQENSILSYLNTSNFHHSCGTSLIFKYTFTEYMFEVRKEGLYLNHINPYCSEGLEFEFLPFPGSIYCINNGENIFMTTEKVHEVKKRQGLIEYYAKKIMKYRPVLSRSLRNEFQLYHIENVNYESTGYSCNTL